SPAAAQASPRRSLRPRLLRKAVSFPTGSFIYKIVPLIVFSPQSNGILAFIIAAFLYFSQVSRKDFHHLFSFPPPLQAGGKGYIIGILHMRGRASAMRQTCGARKGKQYHETAPDQCGGPLLQRAGEP